jgi:site-specific DNA-methyltransferase (adenine-specific)
MWKELKRCCKGNCYYVFFCTTKFGYELINSNKKWFRYDLVWEKKNSVGHLSANKMPLRIHEMIYVFGNDKTTKIDGVIVKRTYNPQKTKGEPYKKKQKPDVCDIYNTGRLPSNNKGDRHPTSILKFNISRKSSVHKTQKPLDLCEWLVKTYSNEGETVLDFTMGSGTTGVACKNTNRNFIGIEKDEDIFKIASKRINDE